MVSKKLIDKYKLDEEEIDLLNEEEKEIGEKENEIFFEEAINNLKKDKLISMRVNTNIINNIKKIANDIGLNYQSYIGVLLDQASKGNIKLKIEQK